MKNYPVSNRFALVMALSLIAVIALVLKYADQIDAWVL